jgi:hypothetical protein
LMKNVLILFVRRYPTMVSQGRALTRWPIGFGGGCDDRRR